MSRRIVLLSGPIASGKTTLGDALIKRFGFRRLKTRELLLSQLKDPPNRYALQRAGDRLDKTTGGAWVARAVSEAVRSEAEPSDLLVDAVRIPEQVDEIRRSFGARVVHVHLTAPLDALAKRFARRRSKFKDATSYSQLRENLTERQVERLAAIADVVIDTNRSTTSDVLVRVAACLNLYGRSEDRLVDVLVGGQYGSEGKGHISSYLAPEYDILVRVGGPNAGHKVYEEPKPFTFHHLPSGTRRTEAKIVLGPGATLWLPGLLKEIAACGVSAERLSIDPRAMIIEEADRAFERRTLEKSIASTAQGVGAATARKVLRTAAKPPVRLARDAKELRPFIRSAAEILDDAYAQSKKILLEGTQGSALSIHHGFYPYVTSRDTTVGGCIAEAGIAPSRVRRIVLVCRCYPIRVQNPKGGTSGRMSRPISLREVARRSGLPLSELKKTERTSTTNRSRRIGEFEWDGLRVAATLNGPTDIALTFADYISKLNRDARRFEQLTSETLRFVEEVERVAGCPVSLIGTRFHSRSIIDRRSWHGRRP